MTTLQWTHSDPRGLSRALSDALARAKAGAWRADAESAADLRALVMGSFHTGAFFGDRRPTLDGDTLRIEGDPPGGDGGALTERAQVARVLVAPWAQLANDDRTIDPQGRGVPLHLVTAGGESVRSPDAGAFPLLAVTAILAGGAAYLAAAIYCADRAAQIIDRQLLRREDTRRLLALDAKAQDVQAAHAAREVAAGKPLPLDDAERAVLSMLADQGRAIAGKREAPMGGLELPKSPIDLLVPALLVGAGVFVFQSK